MACWFGQLGPHRGERISDCGGSVGIWARLCDWGPERHLPWEAAWEEPFLGLDSLGLDPGSTPTCRVTTGKSLNLSEKQGQQCHLS